MGQYTLSGIVKDSESGKALEGANIILGSSPEVYASNSSGSFSITGVNSGEYIIKVSFVGYKTYTQTIKLSRDVQISVELIPDILLKDKVIVTATRSGENSPTAFVNISKEEIRKHNLGQDLPFLLDQTPSVVITSDAGTGIGYTGIRIRGSDPTRVNVTINGVPLNDPESQAVFWVDLPDLASSVEDIQIQRGVGTSTNGSGAFGASINILTNDLNPLPFAEVNNTIGSFGTRKHTFTTGSGLIKDKFAFNVRLSKIASDGYIDRASSDLQSYFINGYLKGDKSLLHANIFSGKEITYQAWDGVNQTTLEANRTFNGTGQINANTFYKNQVDNYKQDHYQLHYSLFPNDDVNLNVSLHYTKGRGFFEQYKVDDDLANYGLPDVVIGGQTISSTDLVRRRWLDNDFYGFTYSGIFEGNDKLKLILGGAWNKYDGDHFGEVIWAQFASSSSNTQRYYDNKGEKSDFNIFGKAEYQILGSLSIFGDLQYRKVGYKVKGIDSDLRPLDMSKDFNFFNPKVGVSYQFNGENLAYASLGYGQREPDRNDFVDAPGGILPKAEKLKDFEIGFRSSTSRHDLSVNFYHMFYKDQLVLTGELNGVGTPLRANVEKSHRTGLEVSGSIKLSDLFTWAANVTYSVNQIKSFREVAAIYDPVFNYLRDTTFIYTDTDIVLSPAVIAGSTFNFQPAKGFGISLISKYVGDQFLDNKSSEQRKLNSFFINSLSFVYEKDFDSNLLKGIQINLKVNNLFDVEYEPNGYTYFILFDDGNQVTFFNDSFVYPQAGTNFLAGISLKF